MVEKGNIELSGNIEYKQPNEIGTIKKGEIKEQLKDLMWKYKIQKIDVTLVPNFDGFGGIE